MNPEDLKPSGRRYDGPDAALVELHRNGHVWTALVHHPDLARKNVVEDVLHHAGDFLRNPMVSGIVELDAWWPDRHQLVYPTSRVWSVGELLHRAREQGKALGLKAGLELAYLGALLLQEGMQAGEGAGAPMHGNPSPWRWLLDAAGELQLIGWGIPALELYAQDEDPELVLPTDCYRYSPPERLEAKDEGPSTDLYALSLAAVELMTGQPVFQGTSTEVRQAAARADVDHRLWSWRNELPEDIRIFLGRALDPYPDGRYDDVEDYVRVTHDLLYGPLTDDMPGLADAVAAYGLHGPRLPTIPSPDDPRWATPERTGSRRWDKPRRSQRHAREPVSTERPEASHALGPRKNRGGVDPRAALRAALGQSQVERDAGLRERLGTAHMAPARLVDRNSLFPRESLSGDVVRFLVELPDGASSWIRLSLGESLASSAARVADKACPTPFDPTGRLAGWYRLVQGDSAWMGDTETRVLDPEIDTQLAFVPNRIFTARLLIDGAEDEPVELEVGTAVHAQFLVSHLRQRFHLRARDWHLWAEEDRPLDRWQILDDHDPDDGFVLRLKRTAGRRRLRRRS